MQISVKSEIKSLTRRLNNIQRKQIPFATALALTRAAQAAKEAVQQEMQIVFDRPTPFTMRGIFIKAATKRNLQAMVWLKGWSHKGGAAEQYLKPQILGGWRKHKGFEQRLIQRGILPSDMYTVPGVAAKLDRYGNLSRGQIVKMLANLQALRDPQQHSNKGSRSKSRYFYSTIRGLRAIWIREGARIRPFLVFVGAPNYRKRLDFHGVAATAARKAFPIEFEKALQRALATAH